MLLQRLTSLVCSTTQPISRNTNADDLNCEKNVIFNKFLTSNDHEACHHSECAKNKLFSIDGATTLKIDAKKHIRLYLIFLPVECAEDSFLFPWNLHVRNVCLQFYVAASVALSPLEFGKADLCQISTQEERDWEKWKMNLFWEFVNVLFYEMKIHFIILSHHHIFLLSSKDFCSSSLILIVHLILYFCTHAIKLGEPCIFLLVSFSDSNEKC